MERFCLRIIELLESLAARVERAANASAPRTKHQFLAARTLLVAAVFLPVEAMGVALLCYERRLHWQTWRFPFASEMVGGNAEATIFSTTLVIEAVLVAALGFLIFGVQQERALRAGAAVAQQVSASGQQLHAKKEERDSAPEAHWDDRACAEFLARLAWVQLCATWVQSLACVCVAFLSCFERLLAHLVFVVIMYDMAAFWLMIDCFAEWQLRDLASRCHSGSGSVAAGGPSCLAALAVPVPLRSLPLGERVWVFFLRGMQFLDELVCWPTYVLTEFLALVAGYKKAGRWEYWCYLRCIALLLTAFSLNVLLVAGAFISAAPLDVLALVEAHTRTGAEVEDPRFPRKTLTLCALTEWFLLITVPGLELMTFWDTLGALCCHHCGSSNPPLPPLSAEESSTEEEGEGVGLLSGTLPRAARGPEFGAQTLGRCSRD